MQQSVHDRIRDLFFNLNEIGVSESEDRKSKKVVVPSLMSSQRTHHGVNRSLKHITVITCVAARGEYVLPYIIMFQESDDLREALRKKGIEFGWPLILKKNQKPHVNRKCFAESIGTRKSGLEFFDGLSSFSISRVQQCSHSLDR
jgi:hypothetical protein